ncbi:MAG: hypothetical protein AAGI01_18315, partial [Myxococcota bacterium]
MHESNTPRKIMTRRWTKMMAATLAACVMVGAIGSTAAAQSRGEGGAQHKLRQKFIPPRVLIKHADDLGLTEEQKSKLKKVVR